MRAVVRRAAALAVLTLAAAGCGDDDGISLVAPERDLQGLWVRYTPPSRLPAVIPRPVYDSLLILNDLTGVWSREVDGSMGIEPLRISEGVRIERMGVRLFLFPLVAPCPNCRLESNDRMMALATGAPLRLHRVDADHFVLSTTSAAGGEVRYYYERRPPPPVSEG
jgi:hypothetical protein